MPHTDANLYISFVAPKPKDIQNLPLITDEKPLVEENIPAPEVKQTQQHSLNQTSANNDAIKEEKVPWFKVSNKFRVIISLILLYITVSVGFFVYNFVFSYADYDAPTNPKSFYPIIGTRLYGSPDLFFKLYDSQGHNFIVTSQRWSSFLKEYGLYGSIGFVLLHFILASLNPQLYASSILFNTILSLCYLFAAFGLVFILAGYLFDMLFPAPIFIYSDKGKILFKIVRRSKGLITHNYLVLTNAYTAMFHITTKKIFFIRKWTIFDEENQIAVVREKSALKALARKLFGHLGGCLRTDYLVQGKNESTGQIISLKKIKTNFRIDIDKPQAFSPSALLAVSAIIFTQNRDKFYPWFN